MIWSEKLFVTIITSDYGCLNNDILLAGINPLEHYIKWGRFENRKYSLIVDSDYIKNNNGIDNFSENDNTAFESFFMNKDIKPNIWLDKDYIIHHNKLKENNWYNIINLIYNNEIHDIIPFFDEKYYVENAYKEGIIVSENPLLHYLREGWKKGINFHPLFDCWYFIETNGIKEITKPYFLYLFDNILYEISPFINIKYYNHIVKYNEIDVDIYYNLFYNQNSLDTISPNLKNNIISYITDEKEVYKLDKQKDTIHNLKEFIKKSNNIVLKEEAEVKLSIIIVNYNKPDLTLLSIYSVINSNINCFYEIIIIENGNERFNTEILYRYTTNIKNLKIIVLKRNCYFGEANNIAMDYARGEFILFLNNDAFINAELVNNLLDNINDHVGAVAPIQFNSDINIIEIGGTITEWLDVIQNCKNRKLTEENYNELLKKASSAVDYASAACLLIKREILNKIGGFDPYFEPFYYEDTDLCLRIRKLGYKIIVDLNSYCLHFENTSTREFLKDKFFDMVDVARIKFLDKWTDDKKEIFEYNHDILPDSPKVGIYTPFQIILGGGEKYILSIASIVSKKYNTHIITENYVSKSRINFIARKLNIELGKFEIYSYDKIINEKYDLVFAMGNEIVPNRRFNAKKLIYHCQFPFPIYHSIYHPNKIDHINITRYLVNSNYTKKEIEKQLNRYKLNSYRIDIVNPPVDTYQGKAEDILKNKNKELTFVNIGRFITCGHKKNQDKFLDILTRLSTSFNVTAYIYGGLSSNEDDIDYFNSIKKKNLNPNILIKANVLADEIVSAYKKSHFIVHLAGLNTPVGIENSSSEHFGISVAEAMSYGCIPIVFYNGGPSEIINDLVGFKYSNEEELYNILHFLCNANNFADVFTSQYLKCIQISDKFNINNFNEKIINLINDTLNEKNCSTKHVIDLEDKIEYWSCNNKSQFDTIVKNHLAENIIKRNLEEDIAIEMKMTGKHVAYCEICGGKRNFEIIIPSENGSDIIFDKINWRETLICQGCGLNNRQRASLHYLKKCLNAQKESVIYITEQVTKLYNILKNIYPTAIGSEFIGSNIGLGNMKNGIRNEDLGSLTFSDNVFDFVLSFDVMEHVPYDKIAFSEIYRVLKPGGTFLFTAPFGVDLESTSVRAEMASDGTIIHNHPPIFHGDPCHPEGCLCYRIFGWDMLDNLKRIGFANASAVFYWSKKFAYLGENQVLFIAKKLESVSH